ncbi:MAG: NADPH-dependent 7-cyano-7-deazaguanine reductase QueF [Myxococcales bacterium FL481]|nr:MAG: NADPH-dependent 7-cyano-7-deazaguanine reductase QueF [Myxococcales bacterium FL481]
MPDPSLLEVFDAPTSSPFLIEHVAEEFTSVCPRTGHPDFGEVLLRYEPAASCVELKSLKLYYQSFRNEGIFYEAVTNQIRDDLVAAMSPRWLQLITAWKGRGGIRSRIVAAHGPVPEAWVRA